MPYYTYKITNLINGKIYIGKAVDVKKRWNKHKTAAKRQDPKDFSIIHRALLKYGFDNFVIETLAEYSTEKEALSEETRLINELRSQDKNIGYNITAGGEGSSGFKHSEESKLQMGKTKAIAYLGEGNPFYGKTHTEETKKILSHTAEQRVGDKNPFFGKNHTDEAKQSMKENHVDKKKFFSEEEIKNMQYKKNVLKISYKTIAQEYGVYWKTISNAVNGRRAYSR
jgi:group I intron endonuclease